MKKLIKNSLLTICGLFYLVAAPTLVSSAKTVTITGNAIITSSIDEEIFRARAIENALQKVLSEGDQNLNSFSLVENGKMLLDQIQSSSQVKILQYDVIQEKVKNNRYHVTLKATIDDKKDNTTLNYCKKAKAENLDFSVNVHKDIIQFPFWAEISKDWVVTELMNYRFEPNLQISETRPKQTKLDELYTLFSKEATETNLPNIYMLEANIFFEKENKHSILEKETVLVATIKTKLKRKGKLIAENNFQQDYIIHKSILNNAFLSSTRGDWDKTKKHFSKLLKSLIDNQIGELSCLKIMPKVFLREGFPFIDYGQIDGITPSDMFVIASNKTQKTYLKITNITQNETQLEIVSNEVTPTDIVGQTVEVVNGL